MPLESYVLAKQIIHIAIYILILIILEDNKNVTPKPYY